VDFNQQPNCRTFSRLLRGLTGRKPAYDASVIHGLGGGKKQLQ